MAASTTMLVRQSMQASTGCCMPTSFWSSFSSCPPCDVAAGFHKGHAFSACCSKSRQLRSSNGSKARTIVVTNSANPYLTFFTPTRLFPQSTTLRLLGSSSSPAHGFGRILALDEFFSGPSETRLPHQDGPQETLIYDLREPRASNWVDEDEQLLSQPKHGLQLYVRSSLQLPLHNGSQPPRALDYAFLTHLRDGSSVPAVLLEDANGGARVKVIAGQFDESGPSSAQDKFLMLDVHIRPGSRVNFPIDPSFSNMVYLVEGVGVFHLLQLMPVNRASYLNEGHGLVVTPTTGCNTACKSLQVSAHPWSHLRFILLGAAPSID